jgi:tetratricopeptide (TPR) repeat protein
MGRVLKSQAFISLVAVLLCSCQSTQWSKVKDDPAALLVDAHFNGQTYSPETEQQIFTLPEDTRRQLHRVINGQNVAERKAKKVLEFIFSYADDGLLYDNASTRTATETLAFGRANCLSLSILAFSMAKEVGMEAVFQDVQIPEYWTSDMNQSWLNGHINVKLRQNQITDNNIGISLLGRDIVVDFDPYTLKNRFPEHEINVQRVVAMFHNNKAASAFSDGNHAQAYRYYRAAIDADPKFAVTWSNLAVLYRVNGLHELAERSYHYSLSLDPTSTNTLSNLAYLYRQIGEVNKAKLLEERVLAKRNSNPYYYLMLGNEAYKRADLNEAINQYNRSLQLDRQNHEAYFGLARTYYLLENSSRASHFLEKALRTATTTQDQQRYEHKLSILNQVAKLH